MGTQCAECVYMCIRRFFCFSLLYRKKKKVKIDLNSLIINEIKYKRWVYVYAYARYYVDRIDVNCTAQNTLK